MSFLQCHIGRNISSQTFPDEMSADRKDNCDKEAIDDSKGYIKRLLKEVEATCSEMLGWVLQLRIESV